MTEGLKRKHMQYGARRVQRGTTLIEAVVAVGIFSMISLTFMQTLTLAAVHIADGRMRAGATAIANQQMEQLRNLPYDDVAVQGGVPSGDVDPDLLVQLGNRGYRVITDIRYVDDDTDGTVDGSPADTIPTDYKIAQIDVTWDDASDLHRVRLTSLFVPAGMEQATTGGTMVINVFDAEGVALSNAAVSIVNATTTPTISTVAYTDASGRVVVPGAPEADEYVISVSKSGYENVTTYPVYPATAFYPNDRNMSVVNGELVTQSLVSSALSQVEISVQDPFGTDITGEDFVIVGGHLLGTDTDAAPVYAVDDTYTTDGDGVITLEDVAAGTYTVALDAGSDYLLFVLDDPTTPLPETFALSQGVSETYAVVALDTTISSVVVHVTDVNSGVGIPDATVEIQDDLGTFAATAQTNAYGDVFFPQDVATPMIDGDYSITITADGYQEASQDVTVSALTEVDVSLAE